MEKNIHIGKVGEQLLLINIFFALIYLLWWFIPSHIGNPYLYGLLLFGELYHVLLALTFWLTIWPYKKEPIIDPNLIYRKPPLDIFITIAGEPVEIVKKTLICAKAQEGYPDKKIYLLNDGFVAKKENWREIEELAREEEVECITRKIPGGAKAGNINNALRQTTGELIVILDADMAPHKDFLKRVSYFFLDRAVGFVQTPQYYKNKDLNLVTKGAWEQQEFFFGPIMKGKDRVNSAFICGTNVAIRRSALEEVGGMVEDNIAEDFLTSLFIHQKGWRSHYLTEVLVEGLAPEDLYSYYKQQLRWARGSLEVLLRHNPFFKRGLTLPQRIQYLSSALYYFNGVIVLIDIAMPLIFLFFGLKPVAATTTSFAIFFTPFMFLNLYTLSIASQASLTFRAISFTQASFILQLQALISSLANQNMGFSITSKKALSGNFARLAYPHLFYIFLALLGSIVATHREGFNPSVATNIAWVLFNIVLFIPFITIALDFAPQGSSLP